MKSIAIIRIYDQGFMCISGPRNLPAECGGTSKNAAKGDEEHREKERISSFEFCRSCNTYVPFTSRHQQAPRKKMQPPPYLKTNEQDCNIAVSIPTLLVSEDGRKDATNQTNIETYPWVVFAGSFWIVRLSEVRVAPDVLTANLLFSNCWSSTTIHHASR